MALTLLQMHTASVIQLGLLGPTRAKVVHVPAMASTSRRRFSDQQASGVMWFPEL
jgi:hypothetical protein